MGRGLIPAILALFLPTYILLYNYSESGVDFTVICLVGIFYAFTYLTASGGGETLTGIAFDFFDPNWYLDQEQYLVDKAADIASASDIETAMAITINAQTTLAAYANLKEVEKAIAEGSSKELGLGLAGMLMGAFVLLLIGGIILNLMDQAKISGILLLIGGIAALGALFFAWDALSYIASQGDWIPIPIGALLALFAGFRAITTPEDQY